MDDIQISMRELDYDTACFIDPDVSCVLSVASNDPSVALEIALPYLIGYTIGLVLILLVAFILVKVFKKFKGNKSPKKRRK